MVPGERTPNGANHPIRYWKALEGDRHKVDGRVVENAEAPCSTASVASALHAGSRREASSRIAGDHDLLDHVVRTLKKRWRNSETKRLGGLEIDHQFEFGRLLDGQVGGLGAFQDLVDIGLRADGRSPPASGPVEQEVSRCARTTAPIHSVYVLPTADGITTSSPNLPTRAWVARQPVQCPGAMTRRLREAMSRTVSGMIFSFAADR